MTVYPPISRSWPTTTRHGFLYYNVCISGVWPHNQGRPCGRPRDEDSEIIEKGCAPKTLHPVHLHLQIWQYFIVKKIMGKWELILVTCGVHFIPKQRKKSKKHKSKKEKMPRNTIMMNQVKRWWGERNLVIREHHCLQERSLSSRSQSTSRERKKKKRSKSESGAESFAVPS